MQVTAQEHNDDTYIITAKEKNHQAFGDEIPAGDETITPINPSDLTAVGGDNSIVLRWKNTVHFGAGWVTEIWYNNHATFTNTTANTDFDNGAIKIHTAFDNELIWEHPFPNISADTTRYYWVRHGKLKKDKLKYSNFHPLSTANGVSGTATAAGGGSGIVYLYKSSVDEPTDDPSADSLFPTVTVALTGDDAGKITGVATGQSSAALTSNQIIDTNGAATGWFTVPQAPTNEQHVIWLIAATASSTGANDEILRAEWTEPVKFSGTSGLNSAIVDLYQLGNIENAPADPSGTLVYTFLSGVLATNNINSWSQTPASPTSTNKYLWKITAAAIGYGQAEIFPKQTQLLLERGDRGSTLNMPYFGGENSTRYAYGKDGVALTPQEFLDYCKEIELGAKTLEALEASPLTESVQWLDQSPPCLQHLVVQGYNVDALPIATNLDLISLYSLEDLSDYL